MSAPDAPILIRPAVAEDPAALGHILSQATAYWHGLDPGVFVEVPPEPIAAHFRAGLQYPAGTPLNDRATLVAEVGGRLVGFAVLTITRPGAGMDIHQPDVRGWLHDLAVEEHWRGRGIGARLLTAAEEWVRARGASWMLLDTHPANVDALRFYQEHMGYAPVGVRLARRL